MINIGILEDSNDKKILKAIDSILFFEVIDSVKAYFLDIYNYDIYNFDIIIIDKNIEEYGLSSRLENIDKRAIILINNDNKILCPKFNNTKNIINYGFSFDSDITLSSTLENTIQFCIQKSLPTLYGEIVEPKEFSLLLPKDIQNIYSILPVVSALILSGISKDNLYLETVLF